MVLAILIIAAIIAFPSLGFKLNNIGVKLSKNIFLNFRKRK